MGHKVHPKIHRTPFIYAWDSKWYAKKDQMPNVLMQEIKIREFLCKKLKDAGIDAISIERTAKEVTITILAAKPGVIMVAMAPVSKMFAKKLKRKFYSLKLKLN